MLGVAVPQGLQRRRLMSSRFKLNVRSLDISAKAYFTATTLVTSFSMVSSGMSLIPISDKTGGRLSASRTRLRARAVQD